MKMSENRNSRGALKAATKLMSNQLNEGQYPLSTPHPFNNKRGCPTNLATKLVAYTKCATNLPLKKGHHPTKCGGERRVSPGVTNTFYK